MALCSNIICANDSVFFGAFNPEGSATHLYLTVYDTTTLIFYNDSINYYKFTMPGSYTIVWEDSNNTQLTQPVNILVYPRPKATFTMTPNSNPICPGTIVTLTKTDSTPSYQNWTWATNVNSVFPPSSPSDSTSPLKFRACQYFSQGSSSPLGLVESNGGVLFFYFSDIASPSGCAVANFDTINMGQFSPIFTFTYPCNGGPMQFTNTSSCPDTGDHSYLWHWTFGDPASGANNYATTINASHTFSAPGNYVITLTMTDTTCGISDSVSTLVTIYAPLGIKLSGDNLTCLGSNPYTYCDSVYGGSGHYKNANWTVSGGTFTASEGNCISVTFSNSALGGVVYYNVTDSATGCTLTDSIVVRGCCGSPLGTPLALEDVTLSNLHGVSPFPTGSYTDKYVSGTWNFANFTTGNPLVIDGILTVDQNMLINNSVVELGTLAQIQIKSGVHLTIRASYLHACSNMWDGIYIQPGGSLVIEGGSLVEDAQNAVVSLGGGDYTIVNSKFNKDLIGIKVKPYGSTHSGTVRLSVFACNVSSWPSLTLGAPATLIAPFTGTRTSEGIEIDSVAAIAVGGGSGLTNTFQNVDFGINCYASNVSIQNNDFNDNTPSPATSQGVFAVYAKGDASKSHIVVVGTSYLNTFENWGAAVFVRDSCNARIENNTITGAVTAIQCWNNFHCTELFTGNTIHGVTQFGINCYNNLTGRVFIENNTIGGAPPGLPVTAVKIDEFTPTLATHYVVNNNSMANVCNGIYAYNLYNAGMNLNSVLLNNKGLPSYDEGVYSAGSFENHIGHNNINTLSFTNTEDGIYVNGGAGSNFVLCNQCTHTNNGCSFSGPSVSTQFVQNQMTSNGNGVLMFASTSLGTQGGPGNPNDNRWFTPTNATNVLGFPKGPAFWVKNLASYNPAPNAGGVFAITVDTTSGTSCYDCATGISSCGGGGGLTPVAALQVIHDSMPFVTYPSTSHWLEKHSLYKYLTEVDSSLLANSVIKHFRDSAKAANMGMLENINSALSDSNGLNGSDVSFANSSLSAIVSPDSDEQTAQIVEGIIIAMQGAHSNFPNASQITTLQTIAPLCPAEYGDAVFVARALLSQVDSAIYINSCENIESVSHHNAQKLNSNGEISTVNAKVYPNPANTLLNVQTELTPGEMQSICLYNSLGQQVKCIQLANEITPISISNLAQGLYFYRITDANGNLIKADKVIILH
jgi:hypothetical protein